MAEARRLGSSGATLDGLKWRLIAALTGATVSVTACGGQSEQRVGTAGSGGDAGVGVGGTGGSAARSGSGGSAGTSARGGTGVGGGEGGAAGSVVPRGGTGGGEVGGTAGSSGSGLGGSGGAGTGGGAGRAPVGVRECVPSSTTDGFEYCEGGFIHRVDVQACTQAPRSGETAAAGAAGAPDATADAGAPLPAGTCNTDADCAEHPHGYCVRSPGTLGAPGPAYCSYGCATDADCDSGSICACTGSTGACTPTNCANDADCGSGRLCVADIVTDVCGSSHVGAFHCQSPADECVNASDCGRQNALSGSCSWDGDHNVCSYAVCGRPFLVAGTLRQAPLVENDTWALAITAAPDELDAAERATIARHYAEAGLMEHASVAAFARFALQLVALGAPARLLAQTAQAMSDETRHAELCFGLARRYGGHAVGPGPLDVTGALGTVTLANVVELVVREGCIGETSAALEARLAAEAARDPLVRDTLSAIAADEERHAVLAFDFVRWAIERDPSCAAVVNAVIERERGADAHADGPAARAEVVTARSAEVLAAHGVLDQEARRGARAATLRTLIPEVFEALSASPLPERSGGVDQRQSLGGAG